MNHALLAGQRAYNYMVLPILLLGLVLRANYLHETHPYVDEYFTILGARAVQAHGYPLLPSGLFYSHGLLYTYLVALLGWVMTFSTPLAHIVRAELVYQLPNLLISGLAMAMLYRVTKEWFGRFAGLVAVALLAVYPYGIVWGARVRMYTLIFFFVPLLAYLFYRWGRNPGQTRWLSYALLGLLLGALAHNWVILLTPVLVVGAGFLTWAYGQAGLKAWKGWLLGLVFIALIVALSSYLQSFWVDVPETTAQQMGWQESLINAIRTRLAPFTVGSGNGGLLKLFVWQNPFNFWILSIVLLGTGWLFQAGRRRPITNPYFWTLSYLYLLFGGAAVEILFLLDPQLKQPRYLSPLMLLAFMIAGGLSAIFLRHILQRRLSPRLQLGVTISFLLALLVGFGLLSARQVPLLFFDGLPPVAYNRAFQFIRTQAAPTDAVLTPLPAAAGLYLQNPIYFIAQKAIYTFVKTNAQGIPADRWLGAPWLNTGQQLEDTLRSYDTVWLVIDQLSFESQFESGWKQLMRYNTPKVWEEDGVMIFRGQGLVRELPTQPEVTLHARLADAVELVGYTRQLSPDGLKLYLFWQALAPLPADYTTFVHLRNGTNETVAQVDAQPLAGQYPTSRWRVGELVIDEVIVPLPATLPPDRYRLLVGLYRWDTLERLPVVNDTTQENAVELETIELK